MFDIGWTEIAIIGLVALIIIGPKDLPRVLRTLGQWTAKARGLTREFRGHVDEMIRESELDDVKQQFQSIGNTNPSDLIENTIDPNGEMRDAMDFKGGELDLDAKKDLDDEVDDALGAYDDIAEPERITEGEKVPEIAAPASQTGEPEAGEPETAEPEKKADGVVK